MFSATNTFISSWSKVFKKLPRVDWRVTWFDYLSGRGAFWEFDSDIEGTVERLVIGTLITWLKPIYAKTGKNLDRLEILPNLIWNHTTAGIWLNLTKYLLFNFAVMFGSFWNLLILFGPFTLFLVVLFLL